MYLVLKRGLTRKIVGDAIKKAGTVRKLAKQINIPRSTIFWYYIEQHVPSEKNLNIILEFINKKLEDKEIVEKLQDNWRQKAGGEGCYKKKIKLGTLQSQLAIARIKASKATSKRHAMMKKKHPQEYYKSQYEYFKKIAEYKETTLDGKKVRNWLEKKVADLLYKNKIKYEYEPLVKIGKRYFFPDFVINNETIIECTFWKGYDKAVKLKEKISFLEKKYKVFVFIPKALYNYYQMLDKYLIYDVDKMTS